MPMVFTKNRLTAPADTTPTMASTFALIPAALVKPMKNCFPYWIPTAYRNSARPRLPTSAGGADLGANQPTASATKRTAPTPRENPLTLISPTM